MSVDMDFDQLLGSWLQDAGPAGPEPSVVDDALATARRTARRRGLVASLVGPAAWPPRRGAVRMPAARRLVAVALIVVLVAVAAVAAGALIQRPPTPPLPSPFRAAAPTSTPVTGPARAALRANWVATSSGIPALDTWTGPVSLAISPDGGILSMDNFAPGASFLSHIDELEPGLVRVTLLGDSGGCAGEAVGTYRTGLSADASEITFTPVADACANRSVALGRTWIRSLLHPTTSGAGVVDSMDPTFFIALPEGTYEARTLDDFVEIGRPDGFSVMVFKDPQGFADPCSTDEERYPYTPGAQAVVEYFQQNDAWSIAVNEPLVIDGHHAVHLVTVADPAYARCPGQNLYMYTPKACICHFWAPPGFRDSHYLVDVGQDTFMFVLSAAPDAATEQAIVESIRIPAVIPDQ
jgi:hypothetical protein